MIIIYFPFSILNQNSVLRGVKPINNIPRVKYKIQLELSILIETVSPYRVLIHL